MIYYFGWLWLVLLSLGVSLLAFAWAVKTGQFSDQNRARSLPLLDSTGGGEVVSPPALWGRERAAIIIILAVGGAAMAGAVVLSWSHGF